MKLGWSRFLLVFLVAFGLNLQTHAGPKSLAEVAEKPEDVAKKVFFGPPPSQLKKLADIGKPKRVGRVITPARSR